jgi:hypothetical protein
MTLTTIAQLLIGEALISPGGPVDAATILGAEPRLWGCDDREAAGGLTQAAPASQVLVTV